MVDGNTQCKIMAEADHPPLLQKSTNAIVDFGQSDGKGEIGLDLYKLWQVAPRRLKKKNSTIGTAWATPRAAKEASLAIQSGMHGPAPLIVCFHVRISFSFASDKSRE